MANTVAKTVGRPTKYTENTCQQVRDYLESIEESEELLPTVEGLSVALGVNKSTLYEWANKEGNKEFSDAMSQVIAAQGRALVNNGLSGAYNPAITKLMLVNNHGYQDRAQEAGTQVNVIINRGGVVLESGGETLAIGDASPAYDTGQRRSD